MVNKEHLKKGQETANEILNLLYYLRCSFDISFKKLEGKYTVPGTLEDTQKAAFHCEGLITFLEKGSKKVDELLRRKQ